MSSGQFRRSYAASCKILQKLAYSGAGEDEAIPTMPDRRPQYDDDSLGVSFFRTFVGQDVEEGDKDVRHRGLENLTLPRTYFGRSQIEHASFRNTDLSESTMCWNDFTDVDFTDADLSGSDLRASNFCEVEFVRANLRNADLRHSTFEECDFTDADLRRAKLTLEQYKEIELSEQQRNEIDWQDSDGEEPPGG